MNVFTIILIAILAGDVLWWWLGDRLARRLPHASRWRLFVGLFMGGQLALVLWVLAGRTESPWSGPPQILSAAAYLWHLLIMPAWSILVLTAGILLCLWRTGRRFRRPAPKLQPTVHADGVHAQLPLQCEAEAETMAGGRVGATATRRQFLGMVTAVTPMVLTGGGAVYSVTQLPKFRIRSMTLGLPSLPRELDGLRIALVSDLHVGTFTDGRMVKRIVEETSRLDADLVLLPGDLINMSLSDLSDALDAVSNMQSRHGSYLSIGNHDLIDNGGEFVRRTRVRVPLLVDESRTVTIRGRLVQLLGLPWSRDEDRIATSVRQLARQIAPGAFPILLAHHPHAFDAAAAAGIPLTVSGHTHGGQLMLRDSIGFGPLLYRYWSGLYRKPEHHDAALVVSNGAGHWFPVRTGAPAEIIHLTLQSVA